MFQDHVAAVIENSENMEEEQLRKCLIELDRLKIMKNKGNIVTSISRM